MFKKKVKQPEKLPTRKPIQMECYNLYLKLLDEQHILVAGMTGSGKSVFLTGFIVTTFAHASYRIICDPKKVDYIRFKNCVGTTHAATFSEIKEALELAISQIDIRYDAMMAAGQSKSTEKPIYVIVDEVATLLSEEPKIFMPLLTKIGNLGRAANVHMILASQCTLREIISTRLQVNIGTRVALHCDTANDSRTIIGVPGAEELPKYGKCLVKFLGESEIIKTPVGVYSEEDIKRLTEFYDKSTWDLYRNEDNMTYKDFNKVSLGCSDIASLTYRSYGKWGEIPFGENGSYSAYHVTDESATIGEHYHLIAEGEGWLWIYDDDSQVYKSPNDGKTHWEIYRSGEFGCIIRRW